MFVCNAVSCMKASASSFIPFTGYQIVSVMEVTAVKQQTQNLMLLSRHYNLFYFFYRNVDYSYFSIEHTHSSTQVICSPKSFFHGLVPCSVFSVILPAVSGLCKEKEEGINCLIILYVANVSNLYYIVL